MSQTAELSNSEVVYNLMGAGHEQSPAEEPTVEASAEPAPEEEAAETGDAGPDPAETPYQTDPATEPATSPTFRVASLGVDLAESDLTPTAKAYLAALDQQVRQFQSRADRAESEARRAREEAERRAASAREPEPVRPRTQMDELREMWIEEAEEFGVDPDRHIARRMKEREFIRAETIKEIEPDLEPVRRQRMDQADLAKAYEILEPMVMSNREFSEYVSAEDVVHAFPHAWRTYQERRASGEFNAQPHLQNLSKDQVARYLALEMYEVNKKNKVSTEAPKPDGAVSPNVASAGVTNTAKRQPVSPPAPRGGVAPKGAAHKSAPANAAPNKSNADVVYELMSRRR